MKPFFIDFWFEQIGFFNYTTQLKGVLSKRSSINRKVSINVSLFPPTSTTGKIALMKVV
jgi:hypothetical protein